jgi:hypothetical protein
MGIDELSDGLDPAEGPEMDGGESAFADGAADTVRGGLESHRILLVDAPTPDPADDLDTDRGSGPRA